MATTSIPVGGRKSSTKDPVKDLRPPATLIQPYGGKLVNLLASDEGRDDLIRRAKELPSIQLSARSLTDLELIATGMFSPLDRFMGEADYLRVRDEMRLVDGTLFPLPILLPIDTPAAVPVGSEIVLRSAKNEMVAILRVEQVFQISNESQHGVRDHFVSGPMRVLTLVRHHDFPMLRRRPADVRAALEEAGNPNVVAYQTAGFLHRAQEEMVRSAAQSIGASLLVQPVTDIAPPGDMTPYTRLRTFMALAEDDSFGALFAMLTLSQRTGDDRQTILQAIMARNFGANCLIAAADGSEHAPDASDLERIARYTNEIGVRMIPFEEWAYVPEDNHYQNVRELASGKTMLNLTGMRASEEYLTQGRPLPLWFVRPAVAEILAHANPPRGRRGFCVWFTGLPSAGKSTIAEILTVLLMEKGRQATVLDGDVVRTHLSKGLGFSREDRDTNILRIGFVAAEIARHQGVVVCAAVSPYLATRERVREMVGPDRFVEVFIDTPLAVCEQRDAKGFYARARAGELTGFTGVDDPYEPPVFPDIALTTGEWTAEENAQRIMQYLVERGFLAPRVTGAQADESRPAGARRQ